MREVTGESVIRVGKGESIRLVLEFDKDIRDIGDVWFICSVYDIEVQAEYQGAGRYIVNIENVISEDDYVITVYSVIIKGEGGVMKVLDHEPLVYKE